MEFSALIVQARAVRVRYAEFEARRYGRQWTPEEIMLGPLGDVGDLEAAFGSTMIELHRRLDANIDSSSGTR